MSSKMVYILGPVLFSLVLVSAGCTSSGATGTTVAQTPAVVTDAQTGRQESDGDVVKNGVYYHQGQPVTQGWNGFPWGAPLSEFRARFPEALSAQSDQTVWFTGEGPEIFFGFKVPVAYHFDQGARFIAVSVTPPNRGMIQTLLNNMIGTLGIPQGQKLEWRYHQVSIYAVQLSVIIKNLADR